MSKFHLPEPSANSVVPRIHCKQLGDVDALWPGIGRARARALHRALGECVTWIKVMGITDPDGMVRAKTRKSGIDEPWKSSYMSQYQASVR